MWKRLLKNEKKFRCRMLQAVLCVLLAAGLSAFAGCGESEEESVYIFYLNEDLSGLEVEEYVLTGSSDEEQIEELIPELCTDTGSAKSICPIPSGVNVESYRLDSSTLFLYFDAAYYDMGADREILCRGAVAQTFLQLSSISNVYFYVDEQPLEDAQGRTVSYMTADSFVDNPGEEIQYIQETELTLYFASEDGQNLVAEVQEVYYSSNSSSLEQLVIERLLEGPESESAQSALPEDTQLVNISVLDGICLVNFDEGFLNYDFDIAEAVVIYSVVNSLTELSTIDTVQISVNGETAQIYREAFSLEEQYERDLSLVTEVQEEVQVVDETEDGVMLSE